MFSMRSLLLVVGVAVGSVQGDAVHVEKRAIRPNPPNGRWIDTWASMPQLTEPANLPPAPFVCPTFLEFQTCLVIFLAIHTSSTVVNNANSRVEPNRRCIRELHHPSNPPCLGRGLPNPSQDIQCLRRHQPTRHCCHGRTPCKRYGRYSSNSSQNSAKSHILWQRLDFDPERRARGL